jgi:hypothetical protein
MSVSAGQGQIPGAAASWTVTASSVGLGVARVLVRVAIFLIGLVLGLVLVAAWRPDLIDRGLTGLGG